MRAILINPEDKSVNVIDFTGAKEHAEKLLGSDKLRLVPVKIDEWPRNIDGSASLLADVDGLEGGRKCCFEFGAALFGGPAMIVCHYMSQEDVVRVAAEVSSKVNWMSLDIAQTKMAKARGHI